MAETLLINTLLFSVIIGTAATCVFLIAQAKRDNSVMDIAYGPLFAIGVWCTMAITSTYPPLAVLIATLMTIWALRLGTRIARKNWGRPEDARYAAWRTAWMARGYTYFLWRSYLQINLLQGLIIVCIATPFLIALSSGDVQGSLATIIGTGIMLFGLTYETIADAQLDRFLARKRAGTETAPIMTTGLFRYSRRPNYFGECLIWLGLAVIASPLPYGWLAFLSPLIITYIVTRVTGPMLEAIFLEKYPADYRAYSARTSYFIPWRSKQR